MTGGIIQLMAKGDEDLYLTYDPSITFFRSVYKRHTNFSVESIPQHFNATPEFGKRITCTINKIGDLIGNLYIHITLPKINKFQESNDLSTLNKCAWVEDVGFHIIKSVDIEIGGRIIDRHYGEYLLIWSELTRKKNIKNGLNKMVGNVPEMTDFTYFKNSYAMYVPLMFWFCRNPGLALPIVALEFSDVKINVEFASLNEVLILAPSHYIEIENYIVHYVQNDILCQTVGNKLIYVKYVDFDPLTRRLYYNKISSDKLQSYVDSLQKSNYVIFDMKRKYCVFPQSNKNETVHINKQKNFSWVNSLTINSAKLFVDYIYLDVNERIKFVSNNHEYLIEILQFDSDKLIKNNSTKIKFGYNHPCKELIFRAQMNNFVENNIMYKNNYMLDYFKTKPIINSASIIMNGIERVSERNVSYYNLLQPFYFHSNGAPPGIYVYSFSLLPEEFQPSGSCNFSKIDDLQISVTANREINGNNPAKIRIYAVCMNILRILDGQAGLAWEN